MISAYQLLVEGLQVAQEIQRMIRHTVLRKERTMKLITIVAMLSMMTAIIGCARGADVRNKNNHVAGSDKRAG